MKTVEFSVRGVQFFVGGPQAGVSAGLRFDKEAGEVVLTLPLPGAIAYATVDRPSLAAAGAQHHAWSELSASFGRSSPGEAFFYFATPETRRERSFRIADVLAGSAQTDEEVLSTGNLWLILPEGHIAAQSTTVRRETRRPRWPGVVVSVATRLVFERGVAVPAPPGAPTLFLKGMEYPTDDAAEAACEAAADIVKGRLRLWGTYLPPQLDPTTPESA